jgi:hypothetical protein
LKYVTLSTWVGIGFILTLILQVILIVTLRDRLMGPNDAAAQAILGLVMAPAYIGGIAAFLESALTTTNVNDLIVAKRFAWAFILLAGAFFALTIFFVLMFRFTPGMLWTEVAVYFGYLSCTIGILITGVQRAVFRS